MKKKCIHMIYTCKRKHVHSSTALLSKKKSAHEIIATKKLCAILYEFYEWALSTMCTRDYVRLLEFPWKCFVCCGASPSFFFASFTFSTVFFYICVCVGVGVDVGVWFFLLLFWYIQFYFCTHRFALVFPLFHHRVVFLLLLLFLSFYSNSILIKCILQFHFVIYIFSRVDRIFFEILCSKTQLGTM